MADSHYHCFRVYDQHGKRYLDGLSGLFTVQAGHGRRELAQAAFDLINPEAETYALDVLSVVESILDDPGPVLMAQAFKERGEAVTEMKADGIEYVERMELLEEVTHPRPLAEPLEQALRLYRETHPWVLETDLSPKSVVRDMYESGRTFTEFVSYYGVARSEGLVLRYLSDAYRALRQTVPERIRTDELDDIVEWLGETVRQIDSSLLDEWEALTDPDALAAHVAGEPPPPARPITGNERAFRVMVRNAMFQKVQLAARDRFTELGAIETAAAALSEPPARVTMAHLQRVLDRVGLLQIDSVNVLTRAHHLPLFSRVAALAREASAIGRWAGVTKTAVR